MTKRLLKTDGRGRSLYKHTDPGVGSWVSWEPLLPVPDTDPAARLLAQQAGPAPVALGLYDDDDARRAKERRRKKWTRCSRRAECGRGRSDDRGSGS